MSERVSEWDGVTGATLLGLQPEHAQKTYSPVLVESEDVLVLPGVPVPIPLVYLRPESGETDVGCMNRLRTILGEYYGYATDVPEFSEDIARVMCSTEITRSDKESLVRELIMGPSSDGPENLDTLFSILQTRLISSRAFHEVAPILDMIAMAKWDWEYEEWIKTKENPIPSMLREATKGVDLPYLTQLRVSAIADGREERDYEERMYGAHMEHDIEYKRHEYDAHALPFAITPERFAMRSEAHEIKTYSVGSDPCADAIIELMHRERAYFLAKIACDDAHDQEVWALAGEYAPQAQSWAAEIVERIVYGYDMRDGVYDDPQRAAIVSRVDEIKERYDAFMVTYESAEWEALQARHSTFDAIQHTFGLSDRARMHDYVEAAFSHELTADEVFPPVLGEDEVARQHMFADFEYLISPWVREQVEVDFGFELHELELYEQGAFLAVLSKQRPDEIERLRSFAQTFGADGARTFLVARYGENYGEVLTKLGERDPELMGQYIPAFNAVHRHAFEIQRSLREGEDLQGLLREHPELRDLGPQLYEGVLRRAKDTLLVLERLADDGEQVTVPYYGDTTVSVSGVQEVQQALDVYGQALGSVEQLVLSKVDSDIHPCGVERTGEVTTFHFVREPADQHPFPYVSLQVRERGVPLGSHDSQCEFDGEARINILMHHSPIATSLSEPSRQEAVSLRLDREGKVREGGAIVENDPTRKDGALSLEIGTTFGNDQSLPGNVVGRVMAAGNYLGLQRSGGNGEAPQYYHNRESFSPALGDANTFAALARAVSGMVERRHSVS